MSLSERDEARLRKILRLGYEIEKDWPEAEPLTLVRLADTPLYEELKREMNACYEAEGDALKRIADRSLHLHDEISLRHFYACLVPFERLSNRALRDDEFVVIEGDRKREAQALQLPVKLIVDNMRSAFNVGALFRTAECLGISEIVLCGYSPDPSDPKTAKTAMGTDADVPWRRVDRAADACQLLRDEGYHVVALETAESAKSLHEFSLPSPIAFVIGNERFGLETDVLKAADSVCRIPVRGRKNSLNAGIAFGIAAFEWLRQHHGQD